MPKKGMKRRDCIHSHPHNQTEPAPQIHGKAMQGKTKARPIVSGTGGANQKVFHTEHPIPTDVYPVIDSDLARDNLQNDATAADLNEL